MHGYDAATYGEGFAEIYDDWYPDTATTGAAVAALAGWAAGGPVLELGVGTGRLAIPLAERGLAVTGLDASAAMLQRMATKPGGQRVVAVEADMGAPLTGGPFSLVFVANNTLFNLTTASAQAGLFAHVAAVLAPGGRFVVEAFVPEPATEPRSGVELRHLSAGRVVLSVHRSGGPDQTAEGSYVELTEAGGVRLRPWSIRYASPTELDDFANRAGFGRESRYAGWDLAPFTDQSMQHVSVYRQRE